MNRFTVLSVLLLLSLFSWTLHADSLQDGWDRGVTYYNEGRRIHNSANLIELPGYTFPATTNLDELRSQIRTLDEYISAGNERLRLTNLAIRSYRTAHTEFASLSHIYTGTNYQRVSENLRITTAKIEECRKLVSSIERYIQDVNSNKSRIQEYINNNTFNDIHEPNNSTSQAKSLQPGVVVNSFFSSANDIDWWSFTVPQDGAIVEIILRSARIDTYVELFESSGYKRDSDDDSGGGTDSAIKIALRSGTYFLKAKEVHGMLGPYSVHLNFQALPRDSFEPDNNSGQAKPIVINAVPQNRTFHDPVDQDWASFTVAHRAKYELTTKAVNSSISGINTHLTLFKVQPGSALLLVAEDDDSGSGNWDARIEMILEPGAYLIRVISLHQEILDEGAYTLQVRQQ